MDGKPSRAAHWQAIYHSKNEAGMSWFEEYPAVSMDFLLTPDLPLVPPVSRDAAIIDIGGGTSRLPDALLDAGFRDITVLDIADSAISRSKARLAERAASIRWITGDITRWQPERQYDIWHDRAVFHFLTNPGDRIAYRSALETAVRPGGVVVIATFALDGPAACSGLAVERYAPETLAAQLGPRFQLTASRPVRHRTPTGALQSFQFSRFTRLTGDPAR